MQKVQHHTNPFWGMSAVLIFFLILAFVTPLGGDDWTWASARGLLRLKNHFQGYNGRLLSNTIELLITRSTIARVLVIGVTNAGLVYLTTRFAVGKSIHLSGFFLLTTGLFVTISTEVYAQTFGWFAGTVNYIFSLLPVLVYLIWVKEGKDNPKVGWRLTLALLALGVVSALNVENITFYGVLLAIAVCWFLRHRSLRRRAGAIGYLVGMGIGAFAMFDNQAYIQIFTGNYAVRQTTLGGHLISDAIMLYTTQMYKYIFQQNGVILSVLAVSLVWLMAADKTGPAIIRWGCSLVLVGYAFFALAVRNLFPSTNFDTSRIAVAESLMAVLFLVAVIVAISVSIADSTVRNTIWFCIVSAVLVTAPFVAIKPYGPRSAFSTITFILIAALVALNCVFKTMPNLPFAVLPSFGVITMVFMVIVMSANGIVDHSRTAAIQNQLSNSPETVYVRKLPFEQYNWDTSPAVYRFQYSMYKSRMAIPTKTKLVFVPFSKWYLYAKFAK
ncbi:DUF6056 family protein [Lacticaseibacillus mingshuiensis]|uniref:DUF6056 family protein n=1 Tax=Lacticaseibacillus mingshuiensis TaxID=2799574 RepID=A0ABW4CFG0_9LACO|nr:DUF6056 family protein [Lacticaseibacillus mingshuiensis]